MVLSTRVSQVLERLVLQVEADAHRADVRTHTRVGRRELARRVETNWEMKEPKQPKPAPGENSIASGNEETAGV